MRAKLGDFVATADGKRGKVIHVDGDSAWIDLDGVYPPNTIVETSIVCPVESLIVDVERVPKLDQTIPRKWKAEMTNNVLQEIIKHFAKDGNHPDDGWAHADDMSSFGLDHRSKDGTKFYLDLNADGIITILWKPAGSEKPKIYTFSSSARRTGSG